MPAEDIEVFAEKNPEMFPLLEIANRTSLDWRNTTRLRKVIPDDGTCHADWAFTTV
jgi:hypothetical protein